MGACVTHGTASCSRQRHCTLSLCCTWRYALTAKYCPPCALGASDLAPRFRYDARQQQLAKQQNRPVSAMAAGVDTLYSWGNTVHTPAQPAACSFFQCLPSTASPLLASHFHISLLVISSSSGPLREDFRARHRYLQRLRRLQPLLHRERHELHLGERHVDGCAACRRRRCALPRQEPEGYARAGALLTARTAHNPHSLLRVRVF